MPRRADFAYDRIGDGYVARRRPDPRLALAIDAALGDVESVVNVGAGTGSYEPLDRRVVAVEPSLTMIRQRPVDAAPIVRGRAEALPIASRSVDAGLAILTIHHWSDWRRGLAELRRVARRRIVILTWDPESDGFWLVRDYFPHFLDEDRRRFPGRSALESALGPLDVRPVPIPYDCTDGFMGAYWRRPSAYLDPAVRASISTFADGAATDSLGRLAGDLATGRWHREHAALLVRDELDVGYRLVIGSVA